MKRRAFLKIAGTTGLSVMSPWSRHAIAADELRGFEAPYWLTINLAGAMDQTLFCDPKGDVTDGTGNGVVNKTYTRDEIITRNFTGRAVRLAPGLRTVTVNGEATLRSIYEIPRRPGDESRHVLDILGERGLTIINGIDCGLTNHNLGEQLGMTGSPKAAFPTLAALIAYQRLTDRDANGPMPLLSFGGYDGTANLVAPTRLSQLSVLGQVTRPNAIGADDSVQGIHGEEVSALIDEAVNRRVLKQANRTRLPNRRHALSQLYMARSNERHVGKLLERFDFDAFGAVSGLKKTGVRSTACISGRCRCFRKPIVRWLGYTCRKRSAPDAKNGGALS